MNNKKLFKRLSLLSGILAISLQCFAQTEMIVVKTDGSEQNFSITESGKLYFDETNLIVEVSNDDLYPNAYIALNTIRKLLFPNYTGVENTLAEQGIAVYPNPAGRFIRIAGGEQEKIQVTLLSMEGKILLYRQVNANEDIDVSHLSPGLYLIRVNTKTLKFIKQ
jgi:hypothetical protein